MDTAFEELMQRLKLEEAEARRLFWRTGERCYNIRLERIRGMQQGAAMLYERLQQ